MVINKMNIPLLHKHTNETSIYEMTQEDVAKSMGLSRIAIQQIERRALFKIRKALKKHNVYQLNDIVEV